MTDITHDRVIGVQYTPRKEEDAFLEEKHKNQHTLEEFAVDFFRWGFVLILFNVHLVETNRNFVYISIIL